MLLDVYSPVSPFVLFIYSLTVTIVLLHSFLHSYPYMLLTYIHLLEYELLSVVSTTPTESKSLLCLLYFITYYLYHYCSYINYDRFVQ